MSDNVMTEQKAVVADQLNDDADDTDSSDSGISSEEGSPSSGDDSDEDMDIDPATAQAVMSIEAELEGNPTLYEKHLEVRMIAQRIVPVLLISEGCMPA